MRTGINLAAVDFVFTLNDPEPTAFFLEINYSFGRRGLGGTLAFYDLLLEAAREWLGNQGFDPNGITLA
jgi:ribosomal protein S6--L-glutamate ligase